MTQDERTEARMRQLLTDVLKGHTEEINGRLNVLHVNLVKIEGNTARIEAQTIKTNGRVTEVEKEIGQLKLDGIHHKNNCPNLERIKILEDDSIGRKAVSKWLIAAVTLSGIIGGLIAVLIQILYFANASTN